MANLGWLKSIWFIFFLLIFLDLSSRESHVEIILTQFNLKLEQNKDFYQDFSSLNYYIKFNNNINILS
jgi:hypothetical protein